MGRPVLLQPQPSRALRGRTKVIEKERMGQFDGFGANALGFLAELAENNRRDWFDANKSRYEAEIVDVGFDFINAMVAELASISPHFEAIPRKTGGSMQRIYRDTRFSKDKTPYKTHLGFHFLHNVGKGICAPSFYVHVDTEGGFAGIGIWRPDTASCQAIRTAIVSSRRAWHRAAHGGAFRRHFMRDGASLKRPPKGIDAADPDINDLKRKDFLGRMALSPEDLRAADFAGRLGSAFATSKPFVKFLCKAVDAPL
jgi:uncharacterized protein (TIGR02453 family)